MRSGTQSPMTITEFLTQDHAAWMQLALSEAKAAGALGEVPIGAVVVDFSGSEPVLVASAHNSREASGNPIGHAEVLAIQSAAARLGRWRLSNCALFVTLEPCLMCSGAIQQSRIDVVIYGAKDPKAGAVESLYQVLADSRLNHRPHVVAGALAQDCSQLLTQFFSDLRQKKKL